MIRFIYNNLQRCNTGQYCLFSGFGLKKVKVNFALNFIFDGKKEKIIRELYF